MNSPVTELIRVLMSVDQGAQWFSGWRAGLPIERFGIEIPARAKIWFEISAPPAPPSQFSYDEHTGHTLSMVSWLQRGLATCPHMQRLRK